MDFLSAMKGAGLNVYGLMFSSRNPYVVRSHWKMPARDSAPMNAVALFRSSNLSKPWPGWT